MKQPMTDGGSDKGRDYTSLRIRRNTHDAFVEKFEMDTAKSHDELLKKMIENYTADVERMQNND